MFCKGSSTAYQRYQRDVLRFIAVYVVVLFSASRAMRHARAEHFYVYFWSVLPALPIIGVILRMARYLRDEKDEYQRLVVMRSILVGTAALLAALVVNDFLRAFAGAQALPAFSTFVLFCVAMGIAHFVQWLRNRGSDDEPAA
ncbi:MAG TPA: hypothetical protein VHY48_03855 [Acidobacteriaceae bacterium]|nr:hypothetical protein [Acidobacteriaceae bacterium]